MNLGPNDLVPCPSDSHRRRVAAHGRICPGCDPSEPWPVQCPLCRDTVTAVGLVVQPHTIGGSGFGFRTRSCPGAGMEVALPVLVEQPIRSERAA